MQQLSIFDMLEADEEQAQEPEFRTQEQLSEAVIAALTAKGPLVAGDLLAEVQTRFPSQTRPGLIKALEEMQAAGQVHRTDSLPFLYSLHPIKKRPPVHEPEPESLDDRMARLEAEMAKAEFTAKLHPDKEAPALTPRTYSRELAAALEEKGAQQATQREREIAQVDQSLSDSWEKHINPRGSVEYQRQSESGWTATVWEFVEII